MDDGNGAAPRAVRSVPVQKRSRERFERILACAADIMAEKGSDALRMSDIVERAGVPFGSLYQYFPDKTAVVATLAERYNAMGRACMREELAGLSSEAALEPVLWRITIGFYQMYRDYPVMRDLWTATQADRALQALEEEDAAFHIGALAEALGGVSPRDPALLYKAATLLVTLLAAAVRQAILLPGTEGAQMLALFRRMLPRDLSFLDDAASGVGSEPA